jgi:phospholipid transport system substrate-binding protein
MNLTSARQMMTPLWRSVIFLGILPGILSGILLVTSVFSAKSETMNDPAAFITNIVMTTLHDLTAIGINDADRATRFRKIIDDTFAVDLAGKWILGQYWKQASASQKSEFLELLKERMVSQNVAHFKRFKADDVIFEIVMTQTISDNDYLVKTRIGGANGGKVTSMGWRVIRRNNRLWVFDVMVEGMSMGIAHQSAYKSVIRKNDGNVEGLLAALRK